MSKSTVLLAMMASSLLAFPALASDPQDPPTPPPPPPPPPPINYDHTGSPPPIPEGGVNCAFISTDHAGNGYWDCQTVMIIVSPEP